MNRYILMLSIILFSFGEAKSENLNPDEWGMVASGTYHDDYLTYVAYEIADIQYYKGNNIEYTFTPFTVINFVHQPADNNDFRYSFRGPVNLLMYGLCKLSLRLSGDDSTSVNNAKLRYLLFAPNSSLNFRLGGNIKLTCGCSTDYLFTGDDGRDRGIVFHPYLGLTASGGPPGAWNGITFGAGPLLFWNFDGDDRNIGWGATVNIFLTDIPNS